MMEWTEILIIQIARASRLQNVCAKRSNNFPIRVLSDSYFDSAIPRFESWHLSQPVRSLRDVSGTQKYTRYFGRLEKGRAVSDVPFS